MSSLLIMFDSAIGVVPAIKDLNRSLSQHHSLCGVESGFEISSGVTSYAYYTGKIISLLPTIAGVFTNNIPTFISNLGTSIPLQEFMGIVGIVTNAARGAKEAVSLYRQVQFQSLFERNAWKGSNIENALAETIDRFNEPGFQKALPPKFSRIIKDKKHLLERLLGKIKDGDQTALEKAERIFARWTGRNIRDKLETVVNMPEVELERALPDWLRLDIANQGGKIYLSNLLRKVNKGDLKTIDEATKLLDTMESYAAKKQVVHALRIIGAVISIISCVGFFIAFPWAISIPLLIIIALFGGAAYVYNSGYVENRDGGFSLKLCVPEFLRNMAFSLVHAPKTIKASVNAKKPKVLTPYPFFESNFEIAGHAKRRTRHATSDIFSGAFAAP